MSVLKRLPGIACAGFCALVLLGGGASAQEKSAREEALRVTSEKMEVNTRKNVLVFIGDVRADRGEVRIRANRLEIYTRARTGEANSVDRADEVEKIVATGNVRLNQKKKRFATAGRLEYSESTGVAILTGDPRVREGRNRVAGAKIEVNFREDKTTVFGSSSQRVNVTLFPSSEKSRRKKSR